MNKYASIINMKYNKSNRHKQMSIQERAAQFMPFQALTGYDDAIKEKGIQTLKKINISKEQKENINNKLLEIVNNISSHPLIDIKYFKKYKNDNGFYLKKKIKVIKIDAINYCITLENKEVINFNDIYNIEFIY